MSTHHSSTLHSFAARIPQRPPKVAQHEAERQARDGDADTQNERVAETGSTSLLYEHKGKLAIGAAAMLGLAVFYRWWESRLAREDPEEYERLRRLKSAIEQADAPPQDEQPT